MMKRQGASLHGDPSKKARTDEYVEEGVIDEHTIVMHNETGEIATIVTADGSEIPVEGTLQETEDGMTIHFQDDGTIEHGQISAGEVAIVSDGMDVMSHEQVAVMGDGVMIDPHHVTIEEQVESVGLEEHVGQITDDSEYEGVEKVEYEGVEKVEYIEQVEESQGVGEFSESQIETSELQVVPQYQNIIIQHMDIAEPLATLRKLLEARLQCSLSDHEFYLQDTIPLEPSKNLVSQCVQGSGMVQINVEVKSHPGSKPRLNIVDILKPAEEVADLAPSPAPAPAVVAAPTTPPRAAANTKVVIPFPEESENVTRWIVDQHFRKEQERLKIPFDPVLWNVNHVKHWIQWAVKEFTLVGVDMKNFNLTGKQLVDLKHEDFVRYIPNDKGDVFWTHLELLRKCKFVAVIQQPTPHAITTITVSTSDNSLDGRTSKSFNKRPRSITIPSDRISPGNRTGNNGQIQLWQFLLELLTDKDYREIIYWVGDDGEFKLNNPEMVAQLWGQRKNKPTMNYEKLSRALRYYYDGDMIAKVHGKRFVYKFVCDLRMLLGYNAGELNRLVMESAEKKLQQVRETLRPAIVKRVEIKP